MSISPTQAQRRQRATGDLRAGLPVVLIAKAGAALIAAVETTTPALLAGLRELGVPQLAITARRAETLKARAYDGDLARLALPPDAEMDWLAAMADPTDDLAVPMKGPFLHLRDGPADLHRAAIVLAKNAYLLPAALVVPVPDASAFPYLTVLSVDDVAGADTLTLQEVVAARLPMAAANAGRVHIFRPGDGGEEHYAIEIGRPDLTRPVLVRLHSACFTGDVLGSLKCDCGPQLRSAMARMSREGAGVLLYLNQEGRGIGLANKLRAYALQDQGFDTVEANHRLGFEDDERDFRIGASILGRMGIKAVRLLTNNPRKLAMMEAQGIRVAERVALHAGETDQNAAYLAVKVAKSGHLP